MTQRPEYELVELGAYCEDLMRQDPFNALCDEYRRQTLDRIAETEPHETKKREGLYGDMRGLREFLNLMLTYVHARESILKAQREQLEDETVYADPI